MYITKISPLSLIYSLLPGVTLTFQKEPHSLVRLHTCATNSKSFPGSNQTSRVQEKKKNDSDSRGTPQARWHTFYPQRALRTLGPPSRGLHGKCKCMKASVGIGRETAVQHWGFSPDPRGIAGYFEVMGPVLKKKKKQQIFTCHHVTRHKGVTSRKR